MVISAAWGGRTALPRARGPARTARSALPQWVGSPWAAAGSGGTVPDMDTEIRQARQDDGPVVVGVDGSPAARAAVRAGAGEAAARGTGLELVLAFPWREHDLVAAPNGFDGRSVLHLAAGLVLEDLADIARHSSPGVPVSTRLVIGGPVDVLLAETDRAQLVCVGSHGTGVLSDMVLGSTTAALVQLAQCPVLAVPGPGRSTTERSGVVVGLDGGEGDRALAGFALSAAAARGCDVVAVRAWEHTVPGSAGVLDPFVDEESAQRREENSLDDTLAVVTVDHPGVLVHRIVERAPATRLLFGASFTAELVVVGHRHQPLGRLGSVAHAMVHRAGCPVAVVPLPSRAELRRAQEEPAAVRASS